MVAESLVRQPSEEGNVVTGPWKGPAYRDPAQADFYLPVIVDGQGELLSVYADKECTVEIWKAYKEGLSNRKWPHMLIGFDGKLIWKITDGDEAFKAAVAQKGCVYSFKTRRCWRPVWFPSTPVERRDLGNAAYENVNLYGYKSFIEGWDKRPKARIFQND